MFPLPPPFAPTPRLNFQVCGPMPPFYFGFCCLHHQERPGAGFTSILPLSDIYLLTSAPNAADTSSENFSACLCWAGSTVGREGLWPQEGWCSLPLGVLLNLGRANCSQWVWHSSLTWGEPGSAHTTASFISVQGKGNMRPVHLLI